MPQAAITAKIHQALDIHGYFASQITFDFIAFVDYIANPCDFGLGQFLSSGVKIDTGFGQYFLRGRTTDAVYIS